MSNPNQPQQPPSYHDLHITTAKIPRTSIFNLPYGLEVTCTRTGGWCLWAHGGSSWAGLVRDGKSAGWSSTSTGMSSWTHVRA